MAQILPCVVGISRAVKDTAPVAFAAGFYEALAFGESVEAAFKLGCAQIELAQEGEQRAIPKLLVRQGIDAAQLRPFAVADLSPIQQDENGARPIWRGTTAAVAATLLVGGAGLAGWFWAHPIPIPR